MPQVATGTAPFGRSGGCHASATFNWFEISLKVEQAFGTVLDSTACWPGTSEQKLLGARVGQRPFMKAKVLAFSPLGMVGRGKVGQKAGEPHVLTGLVGRQSEFAPNSLPGCPLLTPRAQGKELAVHELSSLKAEA